MRIIAGEAGGRRLTAPPGRDTRPTSDRAREGLFGTVTAVLGGLAGRRVLDLFAGSGAVGLEALSRGADHVTLVESSPRAARVIRANVDALGLDGAEVRNDRVERLAAGAPDRTYDLVFADPPYTLATAAMIGILLSLRQNLWLGGGALVVVERASRDPAWEWPEGYEEDRSRRYGEGTLWYGRAAP